MTGFFDMQAVNWQIKPLPNNVPSNKNEAISGVNPSLTKAISKRCTCSIATKNKEIRKNINNELTGMAAF